ncbi:MAG: 16S rRNA (uracil(1498)-N(3))-methyltransferase [Alphaproteobacteria bacterium]|nr:16S rRNA (uracil(1498)-N(3))-methyltransferase [Alphaproteobacteria bacterium]
MPDDRIETRLYVPSSLAVATVGLEAPRAHYLRHVLRLERGARVAVFNASDGEYAARIDGYGKGWCTLKLEEKRRTPLSEPDLWLAFAPIKRARLDFIAEKATELGVSALWPVFTQHTIVTRISRERLVATAIEAAEQSERLSVPEILDPAKLGDALRRWPAGRRLIFCDESGGGAPIADALAKLDLRRPHAILTGPEGGFARGELDDLRKLPFATPVGLGPRVLRADTAALAALAVFQALAHDRLGSPPPRFTAKS